ncbi:MAG: PAS domain-containing protein [Aquabacterium sp.]
MPTLTERKHAAASHHTPRFVLPENSLRMALAAAQAGIWEWHLDTNQSFWSDEVWSLFGLDHDSVQPSLDIWLQTIHPDDRAYVNQTMNAACQCHVPFEIEWRTNPARGPIRWLLSRGQPAKPRGKGRATYTGIVMDITARKRAEHTAHKLNETLEQRVADRTAALSEHERLLQSILDGVPGLVGYWTKDLINRFANKTYGEWFGMTPSRSAIATSRTCSAPSCSNATCPGWKPPCAASASASSTPPSSPANRKPNATAKPTTCPTSSTAKCKASSSSCSTSARSSKPSWPPRRPTRPRASSWPTSATKCARR